MVSDCDKNTVFPLGRASIDVNILASVRLVTLCGVMLWVTMMTTWFGIIGKSRVEAVLFEDVQHRKVKRATSAISKASTWCHVAYDEFVVTA